MMNIAHRGFSAAYPENTLLSFNKALALGVTHLELDLQLTHDGQLIVLHDRSVDRTTNGSGEASDLTLAEIRELDAGIWRGEDFAGHRIPTYREVIEELDKPATLVTELKFRGNEGIRQVIDEIDARDARDRVVISSFDLDKLPVVRELAPDLPTTALLKTDNSTVSERVDQVMGLGADTIGPRCTDTTQELVDAAHKAGLLVRAWGLGRDQGDEMRRLIKLGVDGMTTDCPDILQKILA
jgi:glycerophosphoryl diester phosphodiesterase